MPSADDRRESPDSGARFQINGPNQKPSPDEEKQCSSNLPGGQQGAETPARASCRSGAAVVLQVRIDVRARGRKRGGEPREPRRGQRDRQRKEQNIAVEADGHGADVFVEGQVGSNELDALKGQQQSEAAAKKRDDQALGEQLAGNPPVAGADMRMASSFRRPASGRGFCSLAVGILGK